MRTGDPIACQMGRQDRRITAAEIARATDAGGRSIDQPQRSMQRTLGNTVFGVCTQSRCIRLRQHLRFKPGITEGGSLHGADAGCDQPTQMLAVTVHGVKGQRGTGADHAKSCPMLMPEP